MKAYIFINNLIENIKMLKKKPYILKTTFIRVNHVPWGLALRLPSVGGFGFDFCHDKIFDLRRVQCVRACSWTIALTFI